MRSDAMFAALISDGRLILVCIKLKIFQRYEMHCKVASIN
jgi:hypothetical protein